MTVITNLDAAIRAVCPIYGVSIGSEQDKSSWRIDFREEATSQERGTAKTVLDGFDLAGNAATDLARSQRLSTDRQEALDAKANSALLALVDFSPAQCVTWARTNFPTLSQPEQNKLGMMMTMVAIALRAQVR